jgi:hypothetical protein
MMLGHIGPYRGFRLCSDRLRDIEIASNAAGDIVEIRSALVEIREKSIRFQHEMHKRRRLSHELATDRTGQHQPRLTVGRSGLYAALDRHHLPRIEPMVDPISPMLHQLRARADQRDFSRVSEHCADALELA